MTSYDIYIYTYNPNSPRFFFLKHQTSGGGAGGGPSLHLYAAGDGPGGEAPPGPWRRGVLQEGAWDGRAEATWHGNDVGLGFG